MSSFKNVVVIDGKGHLLGRLSALIAKELLNGQKVVIVRAEEVNISGGLFRSKIRYWQFLRKAMNTNPKRGPFHERAPSAVLKRCIRGMVRYKTARGANAMARLTVYDGCPPHYVKVKKMVIPQALRLIRIKSTTKYAKLGKMCSQVGWTKAAVIAKLEAKRKEASLGWYRKKREALKLKEKATAEANKSLSEAERKLLAEYGY
jgi:large subunit ribosomal protein L13Ae